MHTATQERIHPSTKVRAVDREKLTVDVVASTDSLDSYNSRIEPGGWELEQFKRNPQILWAHNDRGFTASAGLPVAVAVPQTVRVEGNKLLMRLQFTPKEVNDFGHKVFLLVANGFLNGLSVGFDPIEWEDNEDQDGKFVRTYKRQRLLEVSVVTIPANDDALVVRARELNREDDLQKLRAMAAEVDQMAEERLKGDAASGTASTKVTHSSEDIEKWRSYFEQKQPVNKKASTVLKKFYAKVLKSEPPADEGEAWDTMGEAVDALEESPETKPEDVKPEEPKPDEKPQEAAPEEPSKPEPPVEAPQDARKASVPIPLSAVGQLPENLRRALIGASEEALRQGIIPVSSLDAFIDRLGDKLAASMLQ